VVWPVADQAPLPVGWTTADAVRVAPLDRTAAKAVATAAAVLTAGLRNGVFTPATLGRR
jgi:hypothetical protein